MFDTRKQNPNCSLAEEVVSYVYNEMADMERTTFENHLADCFSCTEEIAEFSSISVSIQDWRDEEFSTVATPQIEIPYEANLASTATKDTVEQRKSWLGGIGERLSLSPAFLRTATAFGALVLAIGLGWFLLNPSSNQNSSVAESGTETPSIDTKNSLPEKQEIVSDNGVSDKVEEGVVNETPKDTVGTQLKVVASGKSPKPTAVSGKKSSIRARRSTKRRVYTKKTKPSKKKIRVKKNSKPKQIVPKTLDIQELPTLADLGIEKTNEKEIRLADLFLDGDSDD